MMRRPRWPSWGSAEPDLQIWAISPDKEPPLTWTATGNIAWRPIAPGESCRVLSLDRQTGKLLWDKEVFKEMQRCQMTTRHVN